MNSIPLQRYLCLKRWCWGKVETGATLSVRSDHPATPHVIISLRRHKERFWWQWDGTVITRGRNQRPVWRDRCVLPSNLNIRDQPVTEVRHRELWMLLSTVIHGKHLLLVIIIVLISLRLSVTVLSSSNQDDLLSIVGGDLTNLL